MAQSKFETSARGSSDLADISVSARGLRGVLLFGAAISMAAIAVAVTDVALAQTAAQPAQKQASAKAPQKPKSKAAAKAEPAAEQQEEGQEGAAKQPARKRTAAEIQQQVETGSKLLQAGKADQAIQALSGAIAAGSLPPALLAKAHHQRGAAYRKAGKPAQAIGDFTSALWLKGGLSEADRIDAIEQRTAAYREAGLPDQSDEAGRPAGARTKAASAAAEKTAAAAAKAPAAEAVAKPAAAAALPARQAPDPSQAASSGGGGFFGGLFGGGQQAAAQPAKPAPPPQPTASSWSSATETKPNARKGAGEAQAAAQPGAQAAQQAQPPPVAAQAKGGPPIRTATVTAAVAGQAPGAVAQPAPPGGQFRARLGLARTKAEADALAARVKTEFAKQLQQRQPEISQVAFGSMGSFFQVRVGPFASLAEAEAACAGFKGPGLDCVAVDR